MPPQHFLHHLLPFEALAYLKGMARRHRVAWEQSRYIAFHSVKPYADKGFGIEQMGKFSWEREPVNTEVKNRELAELRREIRERDKTINNGIG